MGHPGQIGGRVYQTREDSAPATPVLRTLVQPAQICNRPWSKKGQ